MSVLVAGAGVAGAVTALELAWHGVPSIVVERAARAPRHSDLLLVSGRGMERLGRLGVADALRAHGLDPGRAAEIVWREALDSPPVLVSRLPSVIDLRHTYAAVTDGSAPIEPYLLTTARALTARLREALDDHPLIDLRTAQTLTDLRLEPDRTVATLLDARAGTRHVVDAEFTVGCDGAQSTVRRCLGIPLVALGRGNPLCTVHFRSRELVRRVSRPTATIAAGMTLVSGHDGDVCVAHLTLGADGTPLTDPAALVQRRFGLRGDPPEIIAAVQQDGGFGVAAAYGKGRAFLAGEAAHRFDPPGADVDTCIGDAVDLGRRLAAVLGGHAEPALLDGYERTRRPRALRDGELARRTLQARARFHRLVAAGTPRDVLAEVLAQEAPQIDPIGPLDAHPHSADVPVAQPLVTRQPADRIDPQVYENT